MTIAQDLTRIQNAKTALKTSIEAKGVTVPSGATIDAYPSLVDSIQTGGGSDSTLIDLIERDLTSLDIPSGTTKIGENTFRDCTLLKSVTIPSSVTSIGNYAFYTCTNLTDITIPSGVNYIYNYAFGYCSKLASITIPDTVTIINNSAFQNCTNLKTITLGNGLTSIGSSAFNSCTGLTSITIPDSVTSIGSQAFNSCTGLTSITIPDSVTSIGSSAFSGCTGLTDITLGSGIETINTGVFYNCTGLTSIDIPDTVRSIGQNAFQGCSNVFAINIPNSVTSIGSGAFSYFSKLISITIPKSVTSIGGSAFDCGVARPNFISVIMESATPPTFSYSVFTNTNNCPIYVPSSSVATYKAASYWSSYASRIKGYTWTSHDVGEITSNIAVGIRFSYDELIDTLQGGVETATVGFTDDTNTFTLTLDMTEGTFLVERLINGHSYQKTYTLAEGETYTLMFDVPMYFDDVTSPEGMPWTMEVAEIDA